jgi:hypothetical protein
MKGAIFAAVITAVGVTASAQSKDPMAGTWRLDVARSHYSQGDPPKAETTVFEAIPGGMNAVSTMVRADGTTSRIDTAFRFDGKEYEVKGAAVKTYRSYKRADERRFEWTNREDGKITTTTVCELSADGRTRTVTTTGQDLKGRSVHNVRVYDREP